MQVVKRITAPMSNEVITLVKDTSLARIILVYELIWAGQDFIKSSGVIWPLFLRVFTICFSTGFSLYFSALSKKAGLLQRLDYGTA